MLCFIIESIQIVLPCLKNLQPCSGLSPFYVSLQFTICTSRVISSVYLKMASLTSIYICSFLLLLGVGKIVNASDPELLTDFSVPAGVNASNLDGNFFTFTDFRGGVNAAPGTFKAVKAFVAAFPALEGLGVSMALLEYQPGSLNPPHTHPRGTELLFVIDGTLTVGLVDTTNKMFQQTLQKGDLFVFPKGLVHFQINPSNYSQAHALAAFSSASPGLVNIPATLFGSGIPSIVLEKAFNASCSIVEQLEVPYVTKS